MAENEELFNTGDRDPHAEDEQVKDEFEVELEADLKPAGNADETNETAPAAPGMNLDGANDAPAEIPAIESRIPAKKDIALREFMGKMDDYAPIVCASPRLAPHLTFELLICSG